MKKTIIINLLLNSIIILGIISLLIEDLAYKYQVIYYLNNILDYIIYILYFLNTAINLIKNIKNKNKTILNIIEIFIIVVFSILFFYNKFYITVIDEKYSQLFYTRAVLIRNIFIFFKIFLRINKVNLFLKRFSSNPALSIIFSFLLVILIGTILLMMPASTIDNSRIGFINALFTSTSAVCVTGLIVVDTGMKFSLFGQIIIMILIQIGGLGIMILSFFTAFIIGKKFTLEEKMTLTYLINENDTKKVSYQIKRIIYITFLVEFFGAVMLYFKFNKTLNSPLKSIFYSLFHSISAFCNAGFSLYTDSFEKFKSDFSFNIIICILIITGGISFSVLINVIIFIKVKIKKYWFKKEAIQFNLSLNTKIVLIITSILIFGGMLVIYQFEHKNFLIYDLKTQYLTSLFQSVTLRTAGFNTINFNNLNNYTYLIMIIFMFIGGASGSTSGGIKVNTLGIVYAYAKSIIKGEKNTILFKKSISPGLINHSFLIIMLYLIIIFFGTLLISIFENLDFIKILFEVASAIGTVGLSAGITSSLTKFSKIIIILLMLFGRIGPLTILSALSNKSSNYEIRYPEENVSIG